MTSLAALDRRFRSPDHAARRPRPPASPAALAVLGLAGAAYVASAFAEPSNHHVRMATFAIGALVALTGVIVAMIDADLRPRLAPWRPRPAGAAP